MTSLDGDRDGATYEHGFDYDRLNKQMKAVYAAAADGQWHTLEWLSFRSGAPEASVSARLRDLRKPRFGGLTVDRLRMGDGLHLYRVTPPTPVEIPADMMGDQPPLPLVFEESA